MGFFLFFFQTQNPPGTFSGVAKSAVKCLIWSKSLFKIRLNYFKQFCCGLKIVSLIQYKLYLMKAICKLYHCCSLSHSYCCLKHLCVGSYCKWPLVSSGSLVVKTSVQQLGLSTSFCLSCWLVLHGWASHDRCAAPFAHLIKGYCIYLPGVL